MIWSKNQDDIFDAALNTNQNIAISATAGAGKTSTIVEAARRLSIKYPYRSILFNAFNKSIVEELQTRLPSTVECSTIHSLGMRALIRHFKTNLQVNTFKTFKFSDTILDDVKFKKSGEKEVYKFTLVDIIDLMRMTMIDVKEDAIGALCDRYDITVLNGEISHAMRLFDVLGNYNRFLTKDHNLIDYTDMVYVPANNKEIFIKQHDIVIVDEFQDTNKVQHLFLERLIKPGGRIIFVGDRKQAIYAFSGADSNSFDLFADRPNTITLPLSVCYRCSKNIVLNAQKINDEIQFFDGQENGEVRDGTVEEITSNDMVICRNVRPLVSLYFKLLEDDKKAFIKGRDIEKGLMVLYSKVKDFDKYDAILQLEDKLEKLEQELFQKGVKKPKEHIKYLNLYEKIRIMEILTNKVSYMFEIEVKIKDLFTDKVGAIELSTIHKSKGREANRVFFLEKYNNQRLIPSKYAIQGWELTQEDNLLFVALTRAKKSLIYITYID